MLSLKWTVYRIDFFFFSKEDIQMSVNGETFSHSNHWENEIKTIVSHHVPPARMAAVKAKGTCYWHAGRGKGTLTHSCLACTWVRTVEDSMAAPLTVVERGTIGQHYPPWVPKGRKSVCQRAVCILKFLVVVFIIARYRITMCVHQLLSKHRKCRPHT